MTDNTIEEIIESVEFSSELYGETLCDIANDVKFIGEIVIFEISRKDLIKDIKAGFDIGDTIKEIGRAQYGDWEALEKIIGKEDAILEQEESQFYKEELITHYEACDECEKVCECHTIGRTILYCEDVYVYSGTSHTK